MLFNENEFIFREIKLEEIDEAAQIEAICFPPHERDSKENMAARIKVASDFFLVAYNEKDGRIAGFLNGVATDEKRFRDDFFLDATLHDKFGKNIMLLGLDVRPEYRGKGLASKLVRHYQAREKERGRQALHLTCLDEKVAMYEKMGFEDLGISASNWGNEKWHEMVIKLL